MEDQAIVRHWFKDHVARLETFTDQKGLKIESLYFANPLCGNYWIRYYQHGGFLMIIGDLGDAIHRWDEVVDLHWISQTEFSYFMSKLRAGREPEGKVWNAEKAGDRLLEFLRENPQSLPASTRQKEARIQAANSLGTKEEWHRFLENYGSVLFGNDYYEYAGIGMKHTLNHLAHWMGLNLAFEALKNKQL